MSVVVGANILVVCTGNICRSPLAERLLLARLDAAGIDRGQVSVGSAGTRAVVGHAMTEQAAAELAGVGGDPQGHLARQLTPELVRDADLVVTATLAHRREVVTLYPEALRRSFTLLELARLLDDADLSLLDGPPAERVRGFGAVVARRRRSPVATEPNADDVVDPFGQSLAVYSATTGQIAPAVEALVRAIGEPHVAARLGGRGPCER